MNLRDLDLLDVLGRDHEGVVEREDDHGDAGDEERVDDRALPRERLLPRRGNSAGPHPRLLELPGADGAHLYVTLFSAYLNWSIVKPMTMAIRMTDCAPEEPRLSPMNPSL